MLTFNLSRELLRWHKRIGIASAFFVLLLPGTGLLLNHSHDLGLDQHHISSRILLRLYGIEQPSVNAVSLNDDVLLQLNSSAIYYQGQQLAACAGKLLASTPSQEMIVLVCEHELLLLTDNMQLIEKVGVGTGLPQPIDRVGVMNELLILKSAATFLVGDLHSLSWSPVSLLSDDAVVWLDAETVTPVIRQEAVRLYSGTDISWERLLLDIHAGRFMGVVGKWLMDIVALLFILLAITGLYLWLKKERKSKKRK